MNWPWKRVIAGVVVIVLAALYFTGSLDNELYKVHLNWDKCAENGFGAVFCGSALTQYENRIGAAEKAAQKALQTLTTTSSTSSAATSTVAAIPASSTASVTLSALPDSTQDQGNFTVTHTCASTDATCFWFGEATQYPPTVHVCPAVFDSTHSIWVGMNESSSGNETQSTAFTPLPDTKLTICIYVYDVDAGTQLVQSYS